MFDIAWLEFPGVTICAKPTAVIFHFGEGKLGYGILNRNITYSVYVYARRGTGQSIPVRVPRMSYRNRTMEARPRSIAWRDPSRE